MQRAGGTYDWEAIHLTLKKRFKGRCPCCGNPMTEPRSGSGFRYGRTKGHVWPRTDPRWALVAWVPQCQRCNRSQAHLPMDEWVSVLRRNGQHPTADNVESLLRLIERTPLEPTPIDSDLEQMAPIGGAHQE